MTVPAKPIDRQNPRFIRYGIILLAFFVGGNVRYLCSFRRAAPPADKYVIIEGSAAEESESAIRSIPRPSLEEVTHSVGADTPNALASYLEDATFDEVTDLLKKVASGETRVEAWQWMILTRGIKLDAERLRVWLEEEKPGFLFEFYRLWSAVEPRSALYASLEESKRICWSVLNELNGEDLEYAMKVIRDRKPGSVYLRELEERRWAERAKEDIHQALKDVSDLADPYERKRSLSAVVGSWASSDPLAALQWIENQDELEEKHALMEVVIEKLADSQPSLAIQKIEALPATRNRFALEDKVITQWAADEPDAALEWLKELPKGMRRDTLLASFLPRLDKSPLEVMTMIKELSVDVTRSDTLLEMEVRWGNGNEPKIGMHYHYKEEIRKAALELANDSPEKAFELLYEIGGFEEGAASVTQLWVDRDPIEAANWVASLPDNDFTQSVREKVFTAWGKEAPPDTAAFLIEHGLEVDGTLSQVVAAEWARQDPGAAIEWASQLPGVIKSEVFDATLMEAANVDPVLALQYLEVLSDAESQELLLASATETWRKQDPVGVMDWLQNQPAEADIDSLLNQHAKAWVRERPVEASEWIGAMESGLRRDQAVVGMLDALTSSGNSEKDFEAAESWVRTIADPEIQQQWMDEISKRR